MGDDDPDRPGLTTNGPGHTACPRKRRPSDDHSGEGRYSLTQQADGIEAGSASGPHVTQHSDSSKFFPISERAHPEFQSPSEKIKGRTP